METQIAKAKIILYNSSYKPAVGLVGLHWTYCDNPNDVYLDASNISNKMKEIYESGKKMINLNDNVDYERIYYPSAQKAVEALKRKYPKFLGKKTNK